MRLLMGIAVGALAALTVPLGEPRAPEPTEGKDLFRGRLTHLDGVEIGHSQVMIVIRGRAGYDKPFSYDLTVACEDVGLRLRAKPGSPTPERDRWMSLYSRRDLSEEIPASEILTPEYRCPSADPARFARVTAVLDERSTLDFEADDHAEFRSEAGSARFKWSPEPMIL